MEETIKKILTLAIRAPSGENCQPWKFAYENESLYLFNVPERDQSLYNFEQRGSLVAHGALLENIEVAAAGEGCGVYITLFPDPKNNELVARVDFSKELSSFRKSTQDKLAYPCISRRATNRKPYQAIQLTKEQRAEFLTAAIDIDGEIKLTLLEDIEAIKAVASAASLNEQLVFENERLREFFFNHVRWNEEEDRKFKNGFYIKTLELRGPQPVVFSLLKYKPIAAFARKIGLPRKIAQENAKTYAASSAFGIITIPNTLKENYVMAGRLFEHIWLKATSLGLSLQPLTGVLFFMQRILGNAAADFSADQIERVKQAYAVIAASFGISNEIIAMLFRIGYGGEPSARCSRFNLDELIDNTLLDKISP